MNKRQVLFTTLQHLMANLCTFCTNSDQQKFVYTCHEIICKQCGTILEESMIDYSPDWSTYDRDSAVFDQNARCDGPVEQPLQKRGVHEMFREMQPLIQELDVSIWNDAKRMYDKMDHVKGMYKKVCAVACLYIAQRQMNSGNLSKTELCNAMCVSTTEFSLALTSLKEVLFRDPQFSHFIRKQSKIEDVLHRMLESISEIDGQHFQKIRSVVFKLHQRVESDKELLGMPSEKVTAGLIYIACKSLCINIKLKVFCKTVDTSCSSVFRIERAIRKTFTST